MGEDGLKEKSKTKDLPTVTVQCKETGNVEGLFSIYTL